MKKFQLLIFLFFITIFFIKIENTVFAYSCKYDCAGVGCSDFDEGERCALTGEPCPGSISVSCTVNGVPNTPVFCPAKNSTGSDCCCNGQGTCCGGPEPTNTPTPTNTPVPTATPTATPTTTPTRTPTPTGCPALCVSSTSVQSTINTYCNNEASVGHITPCTSPNIWQSPMTCQASEPRDPITSQCTWGPYGPNCTAQSCACVCSAPTATPTPYPACTQNAVITLSPGVTSTPTLTPTPGNQAGLVKFKVKLQGVEYDNIAKEEYKTQKVMVTFQIIKKMADGTYQSLLPVTFNNVEIKAVRAPSGKIAIWEGQVNPTGVAIGNNYVIFIKGSKHLQRKFCVNAPTENVEGGYPYRCLGYGQLTLTSGENNLDFSGVLLQGGDLPNQDGIVNAYDVSRVLDILATGESTKTADLSAADIDLNGIVNAKDRSYLIETLEEKYGDEE